MKPHILYISHSCSMHGAEQVMLRSIRASIEGGCRVTVVVPSQAPQEGLDEAARRLGADVLTMPYRSAGRGLCRTLLVMVWNICACLRLLPWMRREKVTSVYSNTSITILGGMLASLTGKRHIWHWHETPDGSYGWDSSMRCLYRRWVGRHHQQIICIAEGQKKDWEQALGIQIEAKVVYNPIRELQPKVHLPHSGVCYGYLGNLEERKNISVLLRSFEQWYAEHSDARLLICGAKNEAQIAQWRSRTSLPQEALEIRLQTQDVDRFYDETDVFVLPSLQEVMPLTAMEAMLKGVCVIQTRRSYFPEMFEDGTDCLFIEPDETSLLTAMRQVWDTDRRNTMAQKGQQTVLNHHINTTFDQTILQICES